MLDATNSASGPVVADKSAERETRMRRRDFCVGLLAAPALARSAMAQEVPAIVLGKQYGLPYLPLMVMERERLVEKHAARLSVPTLKPEYKTLGGTASLIAQAWIDAGRPPLPADDPPRTARPPGRRRGPHEHERGGDAAGQPGAGRAGVAVGAGAVLLRALPARDQDPGAVRALTRRARVRSSRAG